MARNITLTLKEKKVCLTMSYEITQLVTASGRTEDGKSDELFCAS